MNHPSLPAPRTAAEGLKLMAEAAADFRTYSYINQCVIDIVWKEREMGLEELWDLSRAIIFDCSAGRIRVGKWLWKSPEYEKILDSSPLALGSGSSVHSEWRAEYTIPSGITVEIERTYSADIPEEDLITLELLGKVSIEHIPAQASRVEKTVFCPTGSPL